MEPAAGGAAHHRHLDVRALGERRELAQLPLLHALAALPLAGPVRRLFARAARRVPPRAPPRPLLREPRHR